MHALEPPNLTALLNFDFEKETTPIVLVIDYNLVKDKNLLFIQNFIKKNPTVKIIGLFDSFLFQKIQNLFRIGIFGALDKCIDTEEFAVILNQVASGKKIISRKFKRNLVYEFCRKNPEKVIALHDQKNNPIICPSRFYGVSNREIQVLNLVSKGENTKTISNHLSISTHTVETHRRSLLSKLSAKNTADMVRIAVTEKLV